jgi:hypothetical protein
MARPPFQDAGEAQPGREVEEEDGVGFGEAQLERGAVVAVDDPLVLADESRLQVTPFLFRSR